MENTGAHHNILSNFKDNQFTAKFLFGGALVNGDCLEVMPNIKNKSINLILADLPYGTTACSWDAMIPLDRLWCEYNRIIKDDGVIVLTASQPFTTKLISSNYEMFKYSWVWDKVGAANFMNIKNRPFKTHEDVLVFSKTANFTFNPQRVSRSEKSLKRGGIGTSRVVKRNGRAIEHYGIDRGNAIPQTWSNEDGMKHPIDIIQFNVAEKGRYKVRHPTKKPIALMQYLIETYTNDGDIVLDNCMGSGTTCLAAKHLNRAFIGIEKEQKYFEVALSRISETIF